MSESVAASQLSLYFDRTVGPEIRGPVDPLDDMLEELRQTACSKAWLGREREALEAAIDARSPSSGR